MKRDCGDTKNHGPTEMWMLRLNKAPTSRLLHIQTLLAIEKLSRKPSVLCSGEVFFWFWPKQVRNCSGALSVVHGIKGHAWECRTAGNKPAALGIETIVCVPGDVAQAHTNAE
jgi:hypothetical protein